MCRVEDDFEASLGGDLVERRIRRNAKEVHREDSDGARPDGLSNRLGGKVQGHGIDPGEAVQSQAAKNKRAPARSRETSVGS